MEKEKIDGELLAENSNTMLYFGEAFQLFTDDNFVSLKNFSRISDDE